jgi:transcriptional regulator with PAS, ATPase and Fis domain
VCVFTRTVVQANVAAVREHVLPTLVASMAHCVPLARGYTELYVPEIDGDSPEIRRLKDEIARAGRDPDVTVLILGESGTGKERVAGAIHRLSPRARAPFVVINCAALTPTLVEDELFGHVRGAFTGAAVDRIGPFERASGGTVFLDEIGDLPLELQIKLLRALQQRTVQRLGGGTETRFDVRVVAATHADLAEAIARGRFRLDLFYRLSVYDIRVPPLRSRGPGDLRLLARSILSRHAARRRRAPPAIDPAVLARFDQHSWPGNVRELESTLERMLVYAGDAASLTEAALPEGFGRAFGTDACGSRGTAGCSPEAARLALQRCGFNRAAAARALGLSRHQLYRLLRRPASHGQAGGA